MGWLSCMDGDAGREHPAALGRDARACRDSQSLGQASGRQEHQEQAGEAAH